MLGKRLIKAGAVAAGGLVPSEHFETVLYTGNGGTQRIGGYINRGAVFNGSSSKIVSGVPKSSDQSFSFWTNHGSQSNSTATYFGYSNSASNGFFSISIVSGTNISILYWNGSTYARNTSTINIADSNWHHVVVTTSGNVFNIYIDGNSTPAYTTTLSGFTHASRSDLQISYETPDGAASYLNGKIDQFRVFNKVLSSSEVTTLYGETYASSTISTTDIFNDNSGVALYQFDGNANDTGGVSGKFGSAAIFNGSSSIINLGNSLMNNYESNNFSFSCWFNVPSTVINANPNIANNPINLSQNCIFTKADYISGAGLYGFIYGIENGEFAIAQGTSSYDGYSAKTSGASLTADTWHHVAITKTSANSYSIYIDGSLQTLIGQSAANGTFTTNANSRNAYIMHMAAATYANPARYTTGKIDDVRIYSDVLTSTEIGYIYNNTTASIPTDNLVAYYKLDGDARDEQQLYDGTATNVSYAYNGTATNVTYQEATKFTPDLIWIKDRSSTAFHNVTDSVRGTLKNIQTNTTTAEQNAPNGAVSSFNSNGFSVGTGGAAYSDVSANGNNYVAWCFKGGGTAVSNTDGSITSSVSANTTAGFSIVSYTGNGNADASVGHGLSSAPELYILRRYDTTGTWIVFTTKIDGSMDYLVLNTTAAKSDAGQTAPTSSVLNIKDYFGNISGATYIAYCFHSVDGFSKVGSYQGTGATNSIVTGFEPQFIMIKCTSVTGTNWIIYDNERDTENIRTEILVANQSIAENTVAGVDFNSNGFTIYGNNNYQNQSSATYIYLAIAADPDTTTPTVQNSFDVVTYTGDGTGSSRSISSLDFKPDLVWIKTRNHNYVSVIYDSVRGLSSSTNKMLSSASTLGENALDGDVYGYISSFDSNGFSSAPGSSGNNYYFNELNKTYVAWCWKAGDHDDNLPQINTEGSINSVVSVNAAAGFSIVKFTSPSTNTTGFTIGHGLSSTPDLIITKPLDAAVGWHVYSSAFSTPSQSYLQLQSSDAALTGNTNIWNNTAATSTVFSMKTGYAVGTSSQTIAYCFHSVTGYQKIGSYTGNGTSNSITGVGFQPRFVLIKRTDSANGWNVFDSVRGAGLVLFPHTSGAELDNTANFISFDSDGFSLASSGGDTNASGGTYIYLAIK